MTKSTITRERLEELAAGQSGFNLRVATYEESQELARIALAAMEAEPVAWIAQNKNTGEVEIDETFARATNPKYWTDAFPVYRHAQPAPVVPVVPDVMEPTIEAIKRILPTSNPDEYAACIGADMWNACRAAMLSGGKS